MADETLPKPEEVKKVSFSLTVKDCYKPLWVAALGLVLVLLVIIFASNQELRTVMTALLGIIGCILILVGVLSAMMECKDEADRKRKEKRDHGNRYSS